MPKKSESGNGNKARFPKQPHAQKPDREERPGKQERPGNAGGQQARPGLVDGRSQDAQERKMERDENRDRKKRDGGNIRKGCFPKLFMLLLPFAAVGTYFFLMT